MAGKYTFWKLLSEREIEIPVIQRDYAQGRKSAKTIRTEFLANIKNALINQEPLDMNFVYGSIEDKSQFVPIDGQQRLTTLFLLHLYLIHATGKDPANYEQLKNFRYATRMTSTYFCNEIISKKINDPGGCAFKDIESLRDAIIDKYWFGTSWQNDPTVDAMLNMLDAMHNIFKDRDDLEKLLDLLLDYNKCPLYFYYLDLGEYHLEDSIYIKMNARGKALTDYENFKAKLERFLADRKVSDWEEKAGSLDREWTELFWGFVSDTEKKSGKDIGFDDKMMNFIVAYICNELAYYTTTAKRELLRPQMTRLLTLSRTEFTRQFTEFGQAIENESYKIEDSFVDMFNAFNLMIEGKHIKKYAPNNPFYDEEQIFKEILDDNLTHPKRVRFYAYSQYLLNHAHITPEGMTEWLRIVEHLIAGQHFVGPDEFVHVIKGFHWLAENSEDILQFLSTFNLSPDPDSEESDDKLPYFNIYVFREECLKAQLMMLSEDWNNTIRTTESNAYLNGQIYSILEFSGITDEEEPVLDWNIDKQTDYLKAFRHYSEIFSIVFIAGGDTSGAAGLDKTIGNVFRRALLTKGDFTIRAGQNRSFLVNEITTADCSWKRLLRPQKDKDIITKRSYLKALFDDELFDVHNVKESCEAIVSAWNCDESEYRYFIKIPEVMAFVLGESNESKSKSCLNFFRNHDHTKFLLCTTQLNGYSMDYYKYALFCLLKRESPTKLKYEKRNNVEEVNREPVIVGMTDDDVYQINLIRESKQYQITGGKDNIDITKDSLEEMAKYVQSNIIQAPRV